MKIIGNLIFNRDFKLQQSVLEINGLTREKLLNYRFLNLRLFSKQDSVDDSIYIGFKALDFDKVISENKKGIDENLSIAFENYKILSSISGKKVFFQLKRFEDHLPAKSITESILLISFKFDKEETKADGILILTEMNLKNLMRILGVINQFDDQNILNESNLKKIDKILFQKLSVPPGNFSDKILSLPDISLQTLLNHFLHKNIASIDMLAAYIYSLGEEGNRLIDNLSRNVRQQVLEKVKNARLTSTYRWADEVNYIINRNIFVSARELEIQIKGLAAMEYIKRTYEISVLKNQLASRGIEDWLMEFLNAKRIHEIITKLNRKVLVEALSFANPQIADKVFGRIISRDGVQIIQEDIESAGNIAEDKRFYSLVRFFRAIKDIYFTPFVEKLDFESEVTVSGLNGGAIDLIVDEIGFARVIFALKNMPKSWIDSVLKGVLKNLFEDVISGKIRIKKYDDYRIQESRKEFLKALYILSDEEKSK